MCLEQFFQRRDLLRRFGGGFQERDEIHCSLIDDLIRGDRIDDAQLETPPEELLALVGVAAIDLDAPEGGHDLEGVACLLALQLEPVRVLLGEQLVRLVILLHAVEERAEVVDRVERREVFAAKDAALRLECLAVKRLALLQPPLRRVHDPEVVEE